MKTTTPSLTLTLVHEDGRQADFRPAGDRVTITRAGRRQFWLQDLPAEEARQLWRKLLRQGFAAW